MLVSSAVVVTGALGYKTFSGRNIGIGRDHNSYLRENELPVDFKIVPDYELTRKEDYSSAIPEIMKNFAKRSFEDLYERAGIEAEVNIEIGEPVELSSGKDIDGHLQEVEDLLEDPASHGNLVLSSREYKVGGEGENGGPNGYCGTSGHSSRYSILADSIRLNEVPKILEDHFLFEDGATKIATYNEEHDEVNPQFSPMEWIVTGIHELGHNLCLGHSHGEILQEDRGLVSTVMMSTYIDDFLGEENATGKKMPENGKQDRWYSTYFSDTAAEHIRSMHRV